MLFTRCPGCQTTFRITADTLRVANGAVRCGTCATTFSAFSGLQQNELEDDLQMDDELLSPTIQTRELAGIEEFAGPEFEEAPAAENEPGSAATDRSVEQSDAQGEDDNPDIPTVNTPVEVPADPPQGGEADRPLESAEDVELEPLPPEEQSELAADEVDASEPSEELPFDAPADDWAVLLGEIEQSTEEQARAEDEPSAGDSDSRDEEADAEPDTEGFRDVGDPATTESWTEIELSGDKRTGNERVAVGELETAIDMNEPVGEVQTEAVDAASLEAELDISAEEIDATLSAEPDPDLVEALEALEAGLPSQDSSAKQANLWFIGSIALAFVLATQVVHHFRAPLAGQNVAGPLIRGTYGLFGVEVVPDWDLDQYEILNWVATEAGLGNLRISAQIRNNGPRIQPYPHIHLELKDRWEAVVGSRVFEPVEYLQPDADLNGAMVSGVTVPADFAVVDPGEDAYGFELDVCVQREAGRLSCSAQRVFE